MILPTISIMQPWPYAIFHLGKDFENRSWRLPPQYDGVPVLIHTGKKVDKPGLMYLNLEAGFTIPSDLPLGGIVGFAVFTIQCGRLRRHGETTWLNNTAYPSRNRILFWRICADTATPVKAVPAILCRTLKTALLNGTVSL